MPASYVSFGLSLLFFLLHTEDPCSTKQCPFHSECVLDENREAQCTCVQRCSLIFDPVCASDGETYPNECVFKIRACALNGSLTLLHQGHCSEFHCLLCYTSFFNFLLSTVQCVILGLFFNSHNFVIKGGVTYPSLLCFCKSFRSFSSFICCCLNSFHNKFGL